MKSVEWTIELLMSKILGEIIDKRWIDWAYEMLTGGFETEHLLILAGIIYPEDQLYMQDLTNKVLEELHIDYSDKERIVKEYICYTIDRVFTNKIEAYNALQILRDIFFDQGLPPNLRNYFHHFYLLCGEKEDTILG